MEGAAVERNVETARANLLEALDDIGMLGEVKWLDATFLLSERETLGNTVNTDDTLGTLKFSPFGYTLTDGTKTLDKWLVNLILIIQFSTCPDLNSVALIDTGIHDAVIAC